MTIFKGVTLFHHPGFTLGTSTGWFGVIRLKSSQSGPVNNSPHE